MRTLLGLGLAVVVAFAFATAGCCSGSGAPAPPPPAYVGPPNLGPCAADADCRTVEHCHCSCSPLARGVAMAAEACEEACLGDACHGMVAHCNTTTRQCELAAAPAPVGTPAP